MSVGGKREVRVYQVNPGQNSQELELLKLQTFHMPQPVRERDTRPSMIVFYSPSDEKYYRITGYVSHKENEVKVDDDSTQPKARVVKGERPKFVSVFEGRAYVLEVSEYPTLNIPAPTGLKTEEITSICDIRDEVVNLLRLTREVELESRRSRDMTPKYTGPELNVDQIDDALTPRPPQEMAEKIMGLPPTVTEAIRTMGMTTGLHIPVPVHDALLKRIGAGRFRDIDGRREMPDEVVGAFVKWSTHLVCPLEASPTYYGENKLWASAAFAHERIRSGDMDGAARLIEAGLESLEANLRPTQVKGVSRLTLGKEGLSEEETDPRTDQKRENLRHELSLLKGGSANIVRLMARCLEAKDVAKEGGPEFHGAFGRWYPVLLNGVNDPLGHDSLADSASGEERQILSNHGGLTKPETVLLINAVEGFVRAAASSVRDHPESNDELKAHVGGLFGSALCWGTTLSLSFEGDNPWMQRSEELGTFADPKNRDLFIKAMRKLT